MDSLVAGIDLGGTKTAFAVADLKGRVLAQTVHPTPQLPPGKAVPVLVQTLESLVASLKSPLPPFFKGGRKKASHPLAAIGIGVPGLSNPKTGELVWAPNLWSPDGKGWRKVQLGKAFQRSFRCPVAVENDADLALLAETWKGSAKGLKNAVMVTVGTGVGGAFLFEGKLLKGAGAVGWIRVQHGECMENIASGPAILRGFLKANRGRWPWNGKPNTLQVCLAGLKGHPKARLVLGEAALALGWACAGIVSVLNSEAVVFGGGVMDSTADFLLPRIRAVIQKLAQPAAASRVRVLRSKLGNRAGWMGGIAAARQLVSPVR
jgi:glucokinase